ncbi:hypothetical protein HOY80DRAFT_1036862 [Tuber brumale]|nr:hypothetical protein HOY80DRAFT_1036862 [Tuber brumale]
MQSSNLRLATIVRNREMVLRMLAIAIIFVVFIRRHSPSLSMPDTRPYRPPIGMLSPARTLLSSSTAVPVTDIGALCCPEVFNHGCRWEMVGGIEAAGRKVIIMRESAVCVVWKLECGHGGGWKAFGD